MSGARPHGDGPRVGVLDLMTKGVDGRSRSHWTRLLAGPAAADGEHVVNVDPHAGPVPGTMSTPVAEWLDSLDALIVTGAEPCTADLEQDPVHALVGRILAVTRPRSIPVLFSCLSAHSALRHLYGLNRRRLPKKLVGVFPHDLADAAGPRVAELEPPALIPHSRWHTVRRSELILARVSPVLTLGPDDWAVAQDEAGHVFVQGHPEYSAGTLLREYLRDVGRYLQGTSECYPALPVGYLTPVQEEQLTAFAERARPRRPARAPQLTVSPLLALAWLELGRALVADWTGQAVGTARV